MAAELEIDLDESIVQHADGVDVSRT
jgi:hypothetical protein